MNRFERKWCKQNGILSVGNCPDKYLTKNSEGEYESQAVEAAYQGYKMCEGNISIISRLSAVAIDLENKIENLFSKFEVRTPAMRMSLESDFRCCKMQYQHLINFDEKFYELEELQFYINLLQSKMDFVIENITGLKTRK